ncbi:tubulin polyglutamylase complex subunit 2 [Melanaphis sacchari]|uniref:tubulin polyglutamylase complex subunit 2 n=1 Tax=Melanaphis sacchari TaxID=742174 RepID=UPI000DC138E7|nr:tubulin polyglutamylase complex subunit 2 [Melanaphis sacchari]
MADNNKLDLVTSDLFNDQVTLGLLTVLENTTGVRNLTVKQSLPCDKTKISLWEQRNGCLLPDDVKSFYLSCDGFKLTWSYRVEGITSDIGGASNLPIGNITVNPLSDLVRLCDVKSDTVNVNVMRDLQLLDRLSDKNTPDFTENSKIFELDSSSDVGHVCLVYLDGQTAVASAMANRLEVHPHEEHSSASVWLLDTTYRWHLLAPNFSNYFRKALVHMGLPHWQLKFTDMGLTSIGEFFMNLVAPQLNVTDRLPVIGQLDDDEQSTIDSAAPVNHLDPSILKTTFKMSKSKKNSNK